MDAEMKQMLIELRNSIDTLMTFAVPEWISVADLARSLQKDPSTIRKYIKNNFEPGTQYKQTAKNGKLLVRKDAMLQTRMHYA